MGKRDGERTEGEREGVERVMGIEPTLEAWEASVLPLNYTRDLGREYKKPRPALARAVSPLYRR